MVEDRENPHFGRNHRLDQNLKDWYSLLNRGIAITGVGNTDAHRYPSELPGYPRNYVLSDTDNPWEIDPYKVVDALKAGRVIRFAGAFHPLHHRRRRPDGLQPTPPGTGR